MTPVNKLKEVNLMKVLIIGGMGIIGSAITEASCKKGYDVYILSRRPLSKCFIELGVKGVQGDWKNDEFVSILLSERFDVIVDTLIFTSDDLKRDLKLANNKCTQFIFISTDAVYNHPGFMVTEETNIELTYLKWGYGHNKRKAELEILKHCNDYSFYWTIIRPTMTYGDRRIPVGFGSRKNEWTLIKRITESKPVLIFDNGCLHAMCHSTTFGNAVANLFLNNKAYGEFVHISDDKPVRYEDVYQYIAEFFNTLPIVIKANTEVLKSLSPAKYIEMVFDKNPEFTLDNKKIKYLSPDVNYNVDLRKAIESEVCFLRDNLSSMQEDKEYNMLTDTILLSYKKMQLSELQYKQVEKYVSSLSQAYKTTLKKYRLRCKIKETVRPIYKLLREQKNH